MCSVHPERDMNVSSKFHVSPFDVCRDILLKTTNVNLAALEKKSRDHQNH